jgi:acetyl esterase/lipase
VALLCPMLDDRPAVRRELDLPAHRIWDNRNNRAGWSAYLAQPPGSPELPPYAVASRRAELTGLPPTWIAVSDIDLLFDEGRQYSQRLHSYGVPSQLHVIPQAPHGFERFLPGSRLARNLLSANYGFLCEQLTLKPFHEAADSPLRP